MTNEILTKGRFKTWLKEGLIGGLVVMGPIGLMWWFGNYVWGALSDLMSPISNLIPVPYLSDVIAAGLVLWGIVIVGHFTATAWGTFVHQFLEKYISKIPFYTIVKDVIKQLFSGGINFKTVVEARPWGGDGAIVIGYLSGEVDYYNSEDDVVKHYIIYVPSSPNPSNGQVYTLEASKCRILDGVTPADASRGIMSLGTGLSDVLEMKED